MLKCIQVTINWQIKSLILSGPDRWKFLRQWSSLTQFEASSGWGRDIPGPGCDGGIFAQPPIHEDRHFSNWLLG